jgi:rhodanese-related sulfurtransferase
MFKVKYIFLLMLAGFAFVSCGNVKSGGDSETATASTEQTTPVVQALNQSDLKAKLAEANVVLIDVRTPGEVAEGYIQGADKFIDFNGSNFQTEINKLDKSTTYVMYCRSGGRSGKAADFMVNNGFQNVYNLTGGVLSYKGELVK